MSREVDYQVATMRHVREVTAREATKPTYRTGTVTAVDASSRVVTVSIDGGSEQMIPVIDDNYVPRVGHQIVIPMNGDEPVGARPPKGPDASVLLNPDGAIAGDELCPNPGFEGTVKYPAVQPWTASASTSVAQSTVQERSGAWSMAMTRNTTTGTAEASVPVDHIAVTPGVMYNVTAWFRANTTGRSVRSSIEFLDANNTSIEFFLSPLVTDTNAGWTETWMSGVAPENAAKARLYVQALNAVATEVHYIDDVSFTEGVPGAGVSGAKAWLFDANVESWTNVTWTSVGPLSGAGCVVSDAGATQMYSTFGASGEPVVAGKKYSAFAYIEPVENNGIERTGFIRVWWYNSGGAGISSNSSPNVTLSTGVWTQLIMSTITAPGGAAFAGVEIWVNSPGGSQQWRIDTAVLTKPPSVRIRRNLNTTYTQGKATSIEVRALATGVGVVQFPPGLNNDTASPIPVIPGDSWRLSCSYINDAANATKRNVALVATWYDSNGGFTGGDIKQTPITSNPGAGWQMVTDTFKVPLGVAYMRSRIVYLPGAVGETLYLQDVVTQRVPDADAAVQPRGPVHALAAKEEYLSYYLAPSAGLTWTMGDWFLVTDTIRNPMTVEAVYNGSIYGVAGVAQLFFRIGISFDWGATWTYGYEVEHSFDSGYGTGNSLSVRHTRTDVPIGGVYVWAEIYLNTIANPWSFGNLTWRILPA